MRTGLALACVVLSACILPVSPSAPQSAQTVGKGRFGASLYGDFPSLDLLAEGDNLDDLRGAAPAATMQLAVAYGVGDNTDIEVAAEGALYFGIFPIITGGSLGIRQHVGASDLFDFAIAGRVGGVSGSATITTNGTSADTSASATYGAVTGTMQVKHGWFRPLASVHLMPFRIRRDPSDEAAFTFMGLSSSLTAGAMLVVGPVQFGPFATITNYASDRFASGWFPSAGLMLAIRPDKNRRAQPFVTLE